MGPNLLEKVQNLPIFGPKPTQIDVKENNFLYIMNPEDSTHEELAGHASQQIKQEPKESSEDNKVQFEEQEDFKYEINPPDFFENEENQENQEIKEEEQKKVKKPKVKKPKKKKPKVKVKEERSEFEYWNPLIPLDPNNIELSEDFIFFILRQVDVLCENIRNGDPDQERTLEVNRDLNKAVNCYRSKLDLQGQHFINEPIDQDYYDNDDMDYEQGNLLLGIDIWSGVA